MKLIKNMQPLTDSETKEINGGSEATYQNGVNHGKAIKEALVNAWDTVVGWFE